MAKGFQIVFGFTPFDNRGFQLFGLLVQLLVKGFEGFLLILCVLLVPLGEFFNFGFDVADVFLKAVCLNEELLLNY